MYLSIPKIKKYRSFIFCLMLTGIFSGCAEHPTASGNSGQDTCIYYPNLGSGSTESRAYNFTTPCFNPANGDEFVYVRFKNNYPDARDYELRKHTISTGQDILIRNVSGSILYISMDRNGWIFYNDHNFCIWKIRTDGTGLSQVSFTSMFHYSVCPNGQYIVADKLNSTVYQTIVIDNNGSFLDTLNYSHGIPKCWINDTLLLLLYPLDFSVSPKPTQWSLMTYPNKNILSTGTLPYYSHIVDAINAEQILYSDGNLSHFNIGNGTHTVIQPTCGDKYTYNRFSYSKLSGKILLEQHLIEMSDTTTMKYRLTDDILLMNLDGTGKVILPLPQTP